MRVCCCDNQRQRKPVGVCNQAALYILFPDVRGIAACFFSRQRRLSHTALHRQPGPVNAVQVFTGQQTVLPETLNNTCGAPLLERRCAELDEHIPVVFGAFHWQPVLRTKNMPSIAARLSTRFRLVPSGWLVLCSGISGAIFSHSSLLIRHLLPVIFSHSEIINYYILTLPSGIDSKSPFLMVLGTSS